MLAGAGTGGDSLSPVAVDGRFHRRLPAARLVASHATAGAGTEAAAPDGRATPPLPARGTGPWRPVAPAPPQPPARGAPPVDRGPPAPGWAPLRRRCRLASRWRGGGAAAGKRPHGGGSGPEGGIPDGCG